MLALEFPGSDKLIAMINAAVTGDCQRQTTDCIRNGLAELIRTRAVTLPACMMARYTSMCRREMSMNRGSLDRSTHIRSESGYKE